MSEFLKILGKWCEGKNDFCGPQFYDGLEKSTFLLGIRSKVKKVIIKPLAFI